LLGSCVRIPSLLVITLLLAACGGHYQSVGKPQSIAGIPQTWSAAETVAEVSESWLADIGNPQLNQLVAQALVSNQLIQSQALAVDIQQQAVIAAGSNLLPELSTNLAQSRNRRSPSGITENSAAIALDLSYEIDIWGKLSAQQQAAHYEWLAAQANYAEARLQLVADVAVAWTDVIEAQQLAQLFQARVMNAEANQAIISAGYRRGLNSALDVFLVKNELNSESSRLAAQRALTTAAIRSLERLLGDYPAASLSVHSSLPTLSDDLALGTPEGIIQRKPRLTASWNRLLASNASLAFAHKQRLPSLDVNLSLDAAENVFSEVFSAPLGWSLLGRLSAPLFNAGRLRAQEEMAYLRTQQAELDYLNTLYDTYLEVENAMTQEAALKRQFIATKKAKENALNAAELSFEQYQKGLVEYTTVLEAQTRSYDAQASAIQIQSDLLTNRIRLYLALGGDWNSEPNELLGIR